MRASKAIGAERRIVFAVSVLFACGPEVEIESLPAVAASAEIFRDDFGFGVLEHRTKLLNGDVLTAGTAARRRDDGSYRRIRLRLWSARPRRALLGVPDDLSASILADRIALSRGEAHERLRQHEEAKDAYLEAIRAGQADAVVRDAARGLVRVLEHLDDHESRLVYLDALIDDATEDEPAHDLQLERVESYLALDRTDDARAALTALVERYPDPQIVERAAAELRSIEKRRRPSREEAHAHEVARLQWYVDNGPAHRAARLIRRASRTVRNDPKIVLATADLAAKRGRRWQAESTLNALLKRDASTAPAVALRKARLLRDRYRYDRSRVAYQAVVDEHAGTHEAEHAAFEAAAMEYDADEYAAAAKKARLFIRSFPDSPLLSEAEWLAGFAAVLADDFAAATVTFEAALEREDRPRFRYWLGRCYQVAKNDRAATEYERVARAEPLSYEAYVARQRLNELGVDALLDALPSVPTPHSVDAVIGLLGSERPVGIDRAAALFEGNLRREGTEELLSLADHFRRTGDTLGATLVVDLFELFDKDAWVFLLSRRFAETPDADALERRPYYWRVWRYAFPRPFLDEVTTASRDHAVDARLVYSVMRTESLFRPQAVSPVGARGLMQLMPRTARWIGRRDRRARRHARNYRRPDSNIWLGTWNLRFLLDRYDSDVARALAAYNAGPGAVDRWTRRFERFETDEFVERIPYDETRRYVRRAVESYAVYQLLH